MLIQNVLTQMAPIAFGLGSTLWSYIVVPMLTFIRDELCIYLIGDCFFDEESLDLFLERTVVVYTGHCGADDFTGFTIAATPSSFAASSSSSSFTETDLSMVAARVKIKALSRAALMEVRTSPRPPPLLLHTMTAVCALLGHPLKDCDDWSECQRISGKSGFLRRLTEYEPRAGLAANGLTLKAVKKVRQRYLGSNDAGASTEAASKSEDAHNASKAVSILFECKVTPTYTQPLKLIYPNSTLASLAYQGRSPCAPRWWRSGRRRRRPPRRPRQKRPRWRERATGGCRLACRCGSGPRAASEWTGRPSSPSIR